MEGLVDLLPLLFIAAYYLLRGRRRAEQRRKVAPQKPLVKSDDKPRGPTPFQHLLQQIEDAVAEASGDPVAPTPEPTPERRPIPAPAVAPARTAPEFQAVGGSFDSVAPSNHEQHGFGSDNPLSEEDFESRPQLARPRPRGPLPDPHGLRPPPARQPVAASNLTRWRTALRDPKAARDAFVLQTIFGSRGGRQADKRGS